MSAPADSRDLVRLSTVTAFAPATVANVAAGFDVLGYAMAEPGDRVTVRRRSQPGVTIVDITGDDGRLPRAAESNTASVAVAGLLAAIGDPFGADLVLEKGLPLASGLGSSAASSVAAVVAANVLAGSPFTPVQLLRFTIAAERVACGAGHADNVAPALLGGFVLIRSTDPLDVVRLPVPHGLASVVVHPHAEVPTLDSRRVLKRDIRLQKAVDQWGNLAALVAALYTGDLELLGRSLTDVVAEPIRSVLIPGFETVKQAALGAGALGCSISGSGPSLFALCPSDRIATQVGSAMAAAFADIGLDSDIWATAINTDGPTIVDRS